jgi:hypothetical protein
MLLPCHDHQPSAQSKRARHVHERYVHSSRSVSEAVILANYRISGEDHGSETTASKPCLLLKNGYFLLTRLSLRFERVSLLIDLPDAVSERRHSDEKTEEPD